MYVIVLGSVKTCVLNIYICLCHNVCVWCRCACMCACVCVFICYKLLEVTLQWTRLAEQGYRVVGVELSKVAVKRFLTEHKLEHKATTTNNGTTVYEVIII